MKTITNNKIKKESILNKIKKQMKSIRVFMLPLLIFSIIANSLTVNAYTEDTPINQEPLNVDPFFHIYQKQLEVEKEKSKISSFFSLFTSDEEVSTIASDVYYSDQPLNETGTVSDILLARNGNNYSSYLAPSRLYWLNPISDVAHTGYCINPTLAGWNDGGVTYNVDIMEFGDDLTLHSGKSPNDPVVDGSSVTIKQALLGVVSYGFPVTSAETLLGGSSSDFGTTDAHLHYAAYVSIFLMYSFSHFFQPK